MAGITANSATVTMGGGDTSADNTQDGFLVGEQITLATSPTGDAYSWGIAKPSGSTARAALSSLTAASPTFTPDAAGYYVLTVTVDGSTDYVLRLNVTAVTQVTTAEAQRFPPKAVATVPAPASGLALFADASGRLSRKESDSTVRIVDPTARVGTFTLSSGAATVNDTSVTANSVVVHNCTTASNRGTLVFTFTPGSGFSVASSDGSDASAYRYALVG